MTSHAIERARLIAIWPLQSFGLKLLVLLLCCVVSDCQLTLLWLALGSFGLDLVRLE